MTQATAHDGNLIAEIWSTLTSANEMFVADAQRKIDCAELRVLALRYAAAIEAEDEFGSIAVPILVGRGVQSVAAILGAMLAGRAFSPISNAQPSVRIDECLSELGARSILSGLTDAETVSQVCGTVVGPAEIALNRPVPDALKRLPNDLLYVLFTSGSTGKPKGVMCSLDNILNTLIWSADFASWTRSDRIGVASQFSFDIAMFDLFTALYRGVPLVVFEKPQDPVSCLEQINAHQITSIFSVPFFFSQFVRGQMLELIEGSSLQRILSGGDFFPPAHMLAWRTDAPGVALFNVWGPTETSIVNTMQQICAEDLSQLSEGKTASVGTAHARMEVVLLDPDDPVARRVDQAGEIAMLGRAVCLGYLNDPDLTARHQFRLDSKLGFRTADLGRIEDGRLFIEGRTGGRVKIAGYRVDLSEVEAALLQIGSVYLAAAFVQETVAGTNELWACVQPKSPNHPFDLFALKRDLRQRLPRYMVPKRVFVLDTMPLNANGKVDRRAANRAVVLG